MREKTSGSARRVFSLLLLSAAVLLGVLLSPGRVFGAAETEQCVYDNAGLLTPREKAGLEEICSSFFGNTGCHMLILTDENVSGRDSQSLADDFYDETYPQKEQENGVCLLIDMGQRQITLSTTGVMRYYLSDQEIDELLDTASEYASEGEYASALEVMARMCQESYDRGVSEGDYLVDETGRVIHYRVISRIELLVAAAAGIAAGALTYGGIVKRYRKKTRGDLRGTARLQYGDGPEYKQDQLISRRVVTRRIPRTPPPGSGGGSGGGGGSTVHTSSSGQSHGGGSKGF